MIRLTPRSTLFPYTTLFRSMSKRKPKASEEDTFTTKQLNTILAWNGSYKEAARVAGYKNPRSAVSKLKQNPNFTRGIDRKSTRLNSSHTVISYAVFCLKKKK